MSENFCASVVGTTSKVRLGRWAPPLKIFNSMPSSFLEIKSLISSMTSGFAVAVRQSTGGTGSSPALLADETSHIAVVGAEIMSPLREAMGLVNHPARRFPAGQAPACREWLRSPSGETNEYACVSESYAFESFCSARAWTATRLR